MTPVNIQGTDLVNGGFASIVGGVAKLKAMGVIVLVAGSVPAAPAAATLATISLIAGVSIMAFGSSSEAPSVEVTLNDRVIVENPEPPRNEAPQADRP